MRMQQIEIPRAAQGRAAWQECMAKKLELPKLSSFWCLGGKTSGHTSCTPHTPMGMVLVVIAFLVSYFMNICYSASGWQNPQEGRRCHQRLRGARLPCWLCPRTKKKGQWADCNLKTCISDMRQQEWNKEDELYQHSLFVYDCLPLTLAELWDSYRYWERERLSPSKM